MPRTVDRVLAGSRPAEAGTSAAEPKTIHPRCCTEPPARELQHENAVTSQNRRTVTEHAGKCRKFWVYQVEQGQVAGRELLELPIEQSFHESSPHEPHPLDAVQVLITGGMGPGLQHRLAAKGITFLLTPETDPDRAIAAYLQGTLAVGAGSCDHGSDHHHHHRYQP